MEIFATKNTEKNLENTKGVTPKAIRKLSLLRSEVGHLTIALDKKIGKYNKAQDKCGRSERSLDDAKSRLNDRLNEYAIATAGLSETPTNSSSSEQIGRFLKAKDNLNGHIVKAGLMLAEAKLNARMAMLGTFTALFIGRGVSLLPETLSTPKTIFEILIGVLAILTTLGAIKAVRKYIAYLKKTKEIANEANRLREIHSPNPAKNGFWDNFEAYANAPAKQAAAENPEQL